MAKNTQIGAKHAQLRRLLEKRAAAEATLAGLHISIRMARRDIESWERERRKKDKKKKREKEKEQEQRQKKRERAKKKKEKKTKRQ